MNGEPIVAPTAQFIRKEERHGLAFWPINYHAKLLTRLTGKESIELKQIEIIKELGYKIESRLQGA